MRRPVIAATELLKHIVDAREGEPGMQVLLTLAVRVEAFAEIANALLEWGFFERGEWEGFEADGFVVARTIF